jgi:phosphoribosylformimino-5-aminoimidazole carboxamide ribotide isomerase
VGVLIVPAIDLMGGRVVRLVEGQRDHATFYPQSPGDVARTFVEAGAARLHVVDLDGAFAGAHGAGRENRAALDEILLCGVPVQVGGGVRDVDTCCRLFDEGVDRVVVGTWAARDTDAFLAEDADLLRQIIVAVDARDGRVVVHGWEQSTELLARDLAARCAPHVGGILYTDVGRDGTGRGPDVQGSTEIAQAIQPCVLYASGGVGGLADLRALAAAGVPAVIVGKALHDGAFTLAEAISAGS